MHLQLNMHFGDTFIEMKNKLKPEFSKYIELRINFQFYNKNAKFCNFLVTFFFFYSIKFIFNLILWKIQQDKTRTD